MDKPQRVGSVDMYSPVACYSCHGPLDNNPAIDGALVICGECAPNARLIAAAPRMLELLRQIATMSYSVIDMANDAKAILRDVKGGSNG